MKTKGARKDRDDLDLLLAQIREKIIEGRTRAEKTKPVAVFSPHDSQDQWEKERQLHVDLLRLIETLDLFVKKQIEPYMERANPTVDQRIAELEEQVNLCQQRYLELVRRLDAIAPARDGPADNVSQFPNRKLR